MAGGPRGGEPRSRGHPRPRCRPKVGRDRHGAAHRRRPAGNGRGAAARAASAGRPRRTAGRRGGPGGRPAGRRPRRDAVSTVTPEPVKNFASRTFGENDKIALVVGTLVVIAVCALLIGLLSLRNRKLGTAGILLFGVIGAYAAVTRPAGGPLDAVPSL